MTPPPPHPALLARRARVRRIRARVAAGATALFLAAFSGLYVQMATGHDPVIGTSSAQVASATHGKESGAPHDNGHSYFQDPEAFLALGGRRGKQLQVLTDGTYFINRWFATVEVQPKTLIPIGYVGVVISYYGASGEDVTGAQFRYGEQVEAGRRGVWREALAPGKYTLKVVPRPSSLSTQM